MLVLLRGRDQRVIVDDGRLIVTVCGFYRDKVRLGFQAPPEVQIHREEVLERLRRAGLYPPPDRPHPRPA